MSRRDNDLLRCDVCRLHHSLCLCASLPRLQLRTRLCVIMHRDEARKPTNTGRLAAHCITGGTVVVHGRRDELASPPPLAGTAPLVLFPDDDAEILSPDHAAGPPVTLLVPDGTWRQAAKMLRRLPWLAATKRVRLPAGDATRYRLRSEPRDGGLATAEAIARAVGILEGAGPQLELERIFRLQVDRTLYSRGLLPRESVYGGIPDGVMRHDPRRPTADRRP